MSGKSQVTVIAVVGLLAVMVAGALFLAGVFDSTPVDEPAPTDTRPPTQETEAPPVKASEPKPFVQISTRDFTSRDDQGTPTAYLEGDPTGMRLSGIVLDPEGRPVANANMSLILDVSAMKSRPQDGETVALITTAPNGTFAFDNLVGNEIYILQATHPDYASARRHPIDPAVSHSLNQEIKLERGLSISGVVTDPQGMPIAGAEVQVYDMNVQSVDPLAPPERAAKSQPDGTYKVSHLVSGMKKVLARKPSFSSDGRNALDLREGQSQENVNFSLSQGFTIKGLVRDQKTGQPVADAKITARPLHYLTRAVPEEGGQFDAGYERGDDASANGSAGVAGELAPSGDGARARLQEAARQRAGMREIPAYNNLAQKSFLYETAVSDEQGQFVLDGLMEARYMLQVQARGFQPNNGTTADAGAEGIAVELMPSPRIAGRVVDDETSEPIEIFTVATSPSPEPAFIPAQVRQRFKSKDGSFEYVDVRPGKHFLIVEADGYAGGRSEAIQVGNDEEISGIEIRVVRGASLSGLVLDSEGKPVASARVELISAGQNFPDNPFTVLLQNQLRNSGKRRTITDREGRWTLPNVLGGTYKVRVEHSEFAESESSTFTCGNSGEVDTGTVRLLKGATIHGIVFKKDGTPDDKATVMIASADPAQYFSRSVQTQSDGTFEASGLKAGSYRVLVTQRENVFDLVAIIQRGQDPNNVIVLRDGETREMKF